MVDNGEACDDGDDDNSDACLEGCVLAHCGDGYVRDGHEQCDDGNADNSDGCLVGCTVAQCGDGYVHEGDEGCGARRMQRVDRGGPGGGIRASLAAPTLLVRRDGARARRRSRDG